MFWSRSPNVDDVPSASYQHSSSTHRPLGVKNPLGCMLTSQKAHRKQCEGKIFGCGCNKQNNISRVERLVGTGEVIRAFNNTRVEVVENQKNEEKQVRVNIENKSDEYFDNVVLSNVCDMSDNSGNVRQPKFEVQNIHNHLKKTLNTNIQSSSISPSPPYLSDLVMLLKPPRSKKRIILFCLLVLLVFLLATSLPFLVEKLKSGSQPVSFTPLQNVYHQIYGKESQHISAPLVIPLSRYTQNTANHAYLSTSNILGQVFISIKTTQKFHYPRLVILLETWVSLVREQAWFFTDSNTNTTDSDLMKRTGDHLVRTNCSSSHHRLSLCCKMEQEFEHFLRSHKQWWCHFDDDNYVNVVALGKLLERFDSSKPWYLGKTSTASALKIMDINGKTNSSFWFATGGAGFCVSRTLAMKMAPFAVDGKFVEAGNQFWFPDDVTMGYIIEHKLGINLTVIPEFHSHLEPMGLLTEEELETHISFSYLMEGGKSNIVSITGPFPPSIDPTRFYSLHCSLYKAELCPSL